MTLALYILVPVAVVSLLVALALRSQRYRFGAKTVLVASATGLLGLLMTFDGSARLTHGFESRAWPAVTGVVVQSRVEGTRAFHPMVVYEYSVDSTHFRDSTVLQQPSFGGRRRRKEVAETESHLYAPGQEVAVHYDPADPSQSYLVRLLHWSDYGRTATGGIFFGIGISFLLLAWFGRGRPSHNSG